ncbi:MAG: hypothetical protein M3Q10_18195, partial [Chloroflexota bacterium]|nr:hypothetical protein [Chloroflexota bacterium]
MAELTRLLLAEGFRVRCVVDAGAVVEDVERERPAVVVADLLLRDGGLQVALALLERGVPLVLVCSINASTSTPGLEFVPRPIGPTALRQAVARAVAA